MIKGKITYNSSSVVELTEQNPEVILSTAGKYCSGDFGVEFDCPVYDGSIVNSISVTTPPTKTIYTEGETLDLTGLVITATYIDATTKVLTNSEYTTSPANGAVLSINDTNIIINYSGLTCTQILTIS